MNSCEYYLNKEVFIISVGEEDDECQICILEDISEVKDYLKALNSKLDGVVNVYHGVLSSAEFLPAELKNTTPFLVCLSPEGIETGYVIKISPPSIERLVKEIESTVKNGGDTSYYDIPIEYIQILYGYQLEICLTIDDEELEEETIRFGKGILNTITSVAKKVIHGV